MSGASADVPGECIDNTYTFTLTTTDCTGAVTTETVTHTVQCCGYTESGDDGGSGGGVTDPYGYGGYGYGGYWGYGYYW